MNANLSIDDLTLAAQSLFEKEFHPIGDFTLLFTEASLKDYASTRIPNLSENWWYLYCYAKSHGQKPKKEFRLTSFEFQEKVANSEARIQVSRAFNGRAWTVSVRWEPGAEFKERKKGDAIGANFRESAKEFLSLSAWSPKSKYGFDESAANLKPWLFTLHDVVSCLYNYLHKTDSLNNGLILVTGSTNSAKSKIARGLIWRRLMDSVGEKPKRKPHLVTFEDPIEEYLKDSGQYLDATSVPPPIDYTPRSAHIDCGSLDEALTAALRQTPSVFYVGEIRTESDIKRAVEFGGTGHLVVATAHAGNLVEALRKVLKAVGATDPGKRAVFVPKISAVIHLLTLQTKVTMGGEKEPRQLEGIVPCMYRRTPRGMQNLIADGLVSVMPNFPDADTAEQHGSLGRQFFARELGIMPFKPDREDTVQNEVAAQLIQQWQHIRAWNAAREPATGFILAKGHRQLIDVALLEDLRGR